MEKKAVLFKKGKGGRADCVLCSHRCSIREGDRGICRVRINRKGELFTTVYAEPVAASMDPIEKKPFYHFLPGSWAYSIATYGCNFKCGFCQNWHISQPDEEDATGGTLKQMMPSEIVNAAVGSGAKSIAYTYTEPTVFFEYAYDTAKIASESGLKNVFVTNGYMTGEALDMISPYLDAANIDLKFFDDASYGRICGARLGPVLDTIKNMKKAGIWVEVTTLVIPGENDRAGIMKQIAEFIASVSPDIPWHISRFFPHYRYSGRVPTPVSFMESAREAGERAGLMYVYMGNTGYRSATRCPSCGSEILVRTAYNTSLNRISGGKCSECGSGISGVWQ
ncbi:MAG: AmmeMemoRadiSam system radical SAM enzyme [Elusimicrobia bacterium]|nr:AmmeMemoRadiSam system radical SAM enzyme [Elusimicrobiota bacterium]